MSPQSSSRQTTIGDPPANTVTAEVEPRRPQTKAERGPVRFMISPGRDNTEQCPTHDTNFSLLTGDEWELSVTSEGSKPRIECKRLLPPDGLSEAFEGSITAPPPYVPGWRDRSAAGLPMEGIMVSAIPHHRLHQSSCTSAKYTQMSFGGHAQVWIPLTPSRTRFTLKCFPPGPEPRHGGFQCILPSKGHRTDQSSLCISTGIPSRHIIYPYDGRVVMFSDPPGGPAAFPESDDDEEDEDTEVEDRRNGDYWPEYLQKTGFGFGGA
jgi:hypothetical protein